MIPSPENPPYTPAPHLIARSRLTSVQLVTQFQDFKNNLQYAASAPSYVFERLVANLSEDIHATLELDTSHHPKTTSAPLCSDNQCITDTDHDRATEPQTNPAIGTFSTLEVWSRKEARPHTSQVIKFARPHPGIPGLPVGFSMLDLGCKINPRVKTFTRNVRNDSFEINIDSWLDTPLHAASCTWLEIGANDPDFQFGSYNTLEDHPWHQPITHNTRKVTFLRPYLTPPLIVVWLMELDLGKDKDWRVRAFATSVTKTGFTIHLDTWGDSLLYSGVVSWVAYTATRPGVASGHFSTLDIRSAGEPQRFTSGYEEFGGNVFKDPPRVLVALDSFEISHTHDLLITAKASSVSATGMMWHLDTSGDSVLYSAGASYIALS